MIRKTTAIIASIALVVLGAGGVADAKDQGKQPVPLQLPITATAVGGLTFSGTLSVSGFAARGEQVVAIGMLVGSVTTPTGTQTAMVGPLELPVVVGPGLREAKKTGAARQAPIQPQQTCDLLHLDIGPVNFDLLGVVFASQPIGIDLSGDSAGVLGQLVCLILETVGNVVGLVGLLNQLLGVLGGLI